MANVLLTIYGSLLVIGAYFGLKAGSKVSAVMGIISGTLVLLGLRIADTNFVQGCTLIAVVSAVLVVVFTIRWVKTKKIMPAGILLLLSLAAAAFTIGKLLG